MKVSLWAEVRRLHEIERLSGREIARRLHCCGKTVAKALALAGLVRLYSRQEVLAAIRQALQYETYDAAYVEALLLQDRRRRELPSPTPLQPKRRELIEHIHLEEPDPAHYDRLCGDSDDQEPQA